MLFLWLKYSSVVFLRFSISSFHYLWKSLKKLKRNHSFCIDMPAFFSFLLGLNYLVFSRKFCSLIQHIERVSQYSDTSLEHFSHQLLFYYAAKRKGWIFQSACIPHYFSLRQYWRSKAGWSQPGAGPHSVKRYHAAYPSHGRIAQAGFVAVEGRHGPADLLSLILCDNKST